MDSLVGLTMVLAVVMIVCMTAIGATLGAVALSERAAEIVRSPGGGTALGVTAAVAVIAAALAMLFGYLPSDGRVIGRVVTCSGAAAVGGACVSAAWVLVWGRRRSPGIA